ncbi:MAG: fibronectin type III domain-containing protein [Prevotella sp.]|nr:fibronectin type III domain-containing protein [Prevotella sp.]
MLGCALTMMAQNIDFDFPGRQSSEVTAIDYIAWAVPRVESDSKTLDNGMTITIAASDGATALASNWNKNIIPQSKLLGDGVFACHLDNGNYQWISEGRTGITITIEGMTAGAHSILAYHNDTDLNQTHPNVEVSVNGVVVGTGTHSSGATKTSDCGISYAEFTVTEGQAVAITFSCVPQSGETYSRTSIMINGIELDASPYAIMDPVPAHQDFHVDADDGSVDFAWISASNAQSHKLVYGASEEEVANATTYQYEGTNTQYTASGFSPLQRYYWRVDEVDGSGKVYKGKVYSFQPRRLAFPGAEGYGRYAIGGRGGTVYHVTSLEDYGTEDSPIPGTYRYGIEQIHSPRTIVFDVAGVISLKHRLTCSDKFVTIAGQTAPGNGIMLRTCPFGMQSDGITRFLRMRLGHKKLVNNVIPGNRNGYSYGAEEGTSEETTLGGLDGMGMAGNDHAIMDHCSISWTIDEAFSSRNAKGMTLQRTLISEALNQAGHPNYDAGKTHGFAATIGGGELGGLPASYHHNLLAHCEGRNWSISGGLDGKGAYDGHHDIYNNVVYNYGGRATDGGTHEMNFCNNYYKMGANSTSTIMNLQLEGTGTGTQSVYVNGNIRQAKNNGTLAEDKKGDTYKYSTSGGQVVDWDPLPTTPFDFINPEGNMETAQAAFKNVLSDVGCNQPFFDNHDQRMVTETLYGTTSTKGSRTKKAGLIDSEEDEGCEGFDLTKLGIVNAQRDANWDTDQDGIPNWFEELTGTDANVANNNDDRDGDYYTDLEEYLNWIAVPNYRIETTQEITLKDFFAGYASPAYTITAPAGVTATQTGGKLTVTPSAEATKLFTVKVKATEDGISLERDFHFAFSGGSTGIQSIANDDTLEKNADVYDLQGRRIERPTKGIYIINGRKTIYK